VELEIQMVKAFGWSLHDIDETDIESLLPFIHRFTPAGDRPATKKTVNFVEVQDLFR